MKAPCIERGANDFCDGVLEKSDPRDSGILLHIATFEE